MACPDSASSVPFDPALACVHCGRFGAFRFATEVICDACYQTRGSCCAEFPGHDLTRESDAGPASAPPRSASPCAD